jgi:hypothetical protein
LKTKASATLLNLRYSCGSPAIHNIRLDSGNISALHCAQVQHSINLARRITLIMADGATMKGAREIDFRGALAFAAA